MTDCTPAHWQFSWDLQEMDPCRGPPLWNQTHQERLCLYQLFACNICICLAHCYTWIQWRWFFPCPLGPLFRIEYSFIGNPLEICLGSLLSKSKWIYCHWKEWIFPPKTWPFPSLDPSRCIYRRDKLRFLCSRYFHMGKTCAYAYIVIWYDPYVCVLLDQLNITKVLIFL